MASATTTQIAVALTFDHMCDMEAQRTSAAEAYHVAWRAHTAACEAHSAACFAFQESDAYSVTHLTTLADAVSVASRKWDDSCNTFMNAQDAHRWAEVAHHGAVLAALRATYK